MPAPPPSAKGVGLLPIIVTILGSPLDPVVVTVCVTNAGAVVRTCPELVTVTLITELKVVLFMLYVS